MTTLRLDDVNWARSSFCSTNGCVEVGYDSLLDVVLVRDSKLGADSPVISYSPDQWVLLVGRIVAGELPMSAFRIFDAIGASDGVELVWDDATLTFSMAEWDAFEDRVLAGEFDLSQLSAQVPARAVADGAVSGHPGPDAASVAEGSRPGTPSATTRPTFTEVDHLAGVIAEAQLDGINYGAWTLARYILAAGYRRADEVVDVDAELRRRAAPLVPLNDFEDSPTATSDEGAVQTGCGTGGGGEVAPETVGVSAGATEPADECDGADR